MTQTKWRGKSEGKITYKWRASARRRGHGCGRNLREKRELLLEETFQMEETTLKERSRGEAFSATIILWVYFFILLNIIVRRNIFEAGK